VQIYRRENKERPTPQANSKQQKTNANKPKAKQEKSNTSKKQPAAAGKKNLTPY
jgi:hypothetical protein